MPKLPSITGQEAIKAFSTIGFRLERIKSSHHILKREGHPYLLTIPVHGKKNIKPGTLRALIRAAEISVERFCELLE
ncbi:MAG: type II toxin-antitoxin system HicA family toxin [Planctomycetes bacterium]|nr:type II toxin-antitoxin system HicA family toxin [Planctomycetota bacterium]